MGGFVLDSQIVGDKTDIFFLQTPVNWRAEPQSKNQSEGRFFVSFQGKFDIKEYDISEDKFTVWGKLVGITDERPDLCPDRCPKIEGLRIRAWRAYEYYPPMRGR